MLRNERPPRWPYELEPVSGLTGGLKATGARLPIQRTVADEHINQVHRCGGSVGFAPTSRLRDHADQLECWTLKNAWIVAICLRNVQPKSK